MVPKAPEIEESVLGLALTEEGACVTMLAELGIEDFTDRYQKIFISIQDLFSEDAPVNAATIRNYLQEKEWIQDVGGSGITDSLLSAANGVKVEGIGVACEYLKKYTKRRKLIGLCGNYNRLAQDRNEDTEQLLARAGSDFFDLLSDRSGKELGFLDAIEDSIIDLQKPVEDGIMSELDLDNITNGFKPGQLVIIAGKTSHGKSALAQNLMLTAAEKFGHVGFVSMEMTRSEIMERIWSMYCGVPYERIKYRKMTREDMDTILQHKERLKEFKHGFTIIDDGSVEVNKLYATARRLKMQKKTQLLIVDYLQQVLSDGHTREQEVATVSRTLKRIAMDMDMTVIGLSQFNRQASQSHIDRPQLHHLRESGSIEQDANTAILLWNPSVDGKDRFDDSESEGRWAGKSTKNVVELHVAKNRGGKTGTVKIGFDGSVQRFYNLTPEPESVMDYL